jgi:sulfur-carrier protein
MKISIKLFAIYQEVVGTAELVEQVNPGATAGEVLQGLIDRYPQLAPWRSVTRLGINLDFVEPHAKLQDGDELVLIPPVSGG